MSRIVTARIAENTRLASGVFELHLTLPPGYPSPRPGQFVNLYLNDTGLLLPRPISVCGYRGGQLILVYAVAGRGTGMLSDYGPGTGMRLSTPLGNGFSLPDTGRCLLVGGGAGAAPLLFLSRAAAQAGVGFNVALGFRNKPFLADAFPGGADIATEDGVSGFRGNVVELLERTGIAPATRIFACGPKSMLRALAGLAGRLGLPLQVSLEERMGCGYGGCLGCVCKTRGGSRKVCEDGPVFDAEEVVWE